MNKLKILPIFLILSLGLMFSLVSAEDSAICTDSDGGLVPNIFGSINFAFGTFQSTHEDACALVSSYDSDGTPGGWQGVDSCSGENCYIEEAFCRTDENGNFIDADADQMIKCSVGCNNGQCTSASQGVYSITIKGKLIDQLSGKPVEGAQLMSAYEFSPSNVVTDENGNFEFSVNSDFKIKEGPETGKGDVGAQWTFFKDCYDYGYIVLQKNYEVWSSGKLQNTYSIALRQTVFDEDERVKDISDKKIIDLGSLEIYPNADVSIESDIATSFNVMYKYKNREGYNGPGQSGYTTEHYLSSALPLDYDVYIQFEDASGNEYQSSTYRIPSNARCGVISLEYFNGESEWFVLTEVTPTEETGPVKIEIPEVVKKENPNTISRLCLGCLKDDTCYPLGYRKSGEYCSESKTFTSQLEADSTCENNFECSSNLCIDSQCISSGFWQKIMNWFKNLFG